MSMDLPLGMWPVTVGLLTVTAYSILRLQKSGQLRRKSILVLLISSVTVFVALPMYAVVFWADHKNSRPEVQQLPSDILGVFWWAYVLVVLLSVAFTKGYRLPSAALAGFSLWINFSIFLICIMAVSGVWL